MVPKLIIFRIFVAACRLEGSDAAANALEASGSSHKRIVSLTHCTLSDKASQESVRNGLAHRLEGSEAAADALQAVGVAAAAAAQAALAETGPLAPPPSLLEGDFLAHLTAMLDRAGAGTCAEFCRVTRVERRRRRCWRTTAWRT